MTPVYVLRGHIKPYVRMTQKGKFTSPAAQEYLFSQDSVRWQLHETMLRMQSTEWAGQYVMLPARTPLAADFLFGVTRVHTCDLDNQIKAILDACKGILIPDDRWVDQIISRRRILKDQFADELCVFSIEPLKSSGTYVAPSLLSFDQYITPV